jgi:hypothetical protein
LGLGLLRPASAPLMGCVGWAPPAPAELEAPLLALSRSVQKVLGHGLSRCALPSGWAACCTPSCGVAQAKAVGGGRGLPCSQVPVLALSGRALWTLGIYGQLEIHNKLLHLQRWQALSFVGATECIMCLTA